MAVKSTSKEKSRIAYRNWQLKDSVDNRIAFLKSLEPYLSTICWRIIRQRNKFMSYLDAECLTTQIITDCYQVLDKIDKKRHYYAVITYLMRFIEGHFLSLNTFVRTQKRTAIVVDIDRLVRHQNFKDAPIINLMAPKDDYVKSFKFFELFDAFCLHYKIKDKYKIAMLDRYFYGLTCDEMAAKYGVSRQYLDAEIQKIFKRIRKSDSPFKKELKGMLYDNDRDIRYGHYEQYQNRTHYNYRHHLRQKKGFK